LDIGTRPNKNAVIIPKTRDSVSFYIDDSALVDKVKAAGFDILPISAEPKRPFNRNKHRVEHLTVSAIKSNEVLISELLNHSFNVVRNRRTKGK
jgi:hypothetical protein